MATHTQCTLRRGASVTTSWIPTRYANEGAYLRLKEGGEWVDGWRVDAVGTTLDSGAVMSMRDEHRSHRSVTDV